MAEVITSIGSDTSTGTATPSSCSGSGGSSGYSVTFSSAPSGVARGDMVQMTDEASYYSTFTYRVVSISGSTLTFVYVTDDMWTGDTSPCDLLDMSWEQAECNFSRFYSSIYEWIEDTGNTDIYGSGDDVVGECHNDSAFDESNTISAVSGLDSIKLTVHPDSRHNGTAGTGARIDLTGSGGTPIVVNGDDITVEWLEINCTDATHAEAALEVTGSALESVIIRNMILHDVDPDDDVDDRWGIKVINSTAGTVTRSILNNFIYNIKRGDASPSQQRNCKGIGEYSTESSDDAGANYYNNTLRGISTTNGTAYGYYVSDESKLVNNIALACGTDCYKVFDGSSGNQSSQYNLSDDLTAADLGVQPPYDNHAQTSATGVTAAYTTVSSTDLHLRWVLNDPISLAVDRGINLSGPDGILTDIDGDDRVYNIPSSVARGYWDIGADESVYSHPYPVEAGTETEYRPPILPSPASFVLAADSPSVDIPSVSVAPVAAALILMAVSPAIQMSSLSVTPSTASLEIAAETPTVEQTSVSVTPSASAFELAADNPTVNVLLPSVSIAPDSATFEVAASSPDIVLGNITIANSVSAFELSADNPTVEQPSSSVTPAASAFELVADSPAVGQSSVSVTPAVSAFELAADSPSVIIPLVVSPSAAIVELSSSNPTTYSGSISISLSSSNVVLSAPNASSVMGSVSFGVSDATFELASEYSGVGLGSMTVDVSPASIELTGNVGSIVSGSVSISPASGAVELTTNIGGVVAGSIVVVIPEHANFDYAASSPSVGLSSMTVDVSSAAVEVEADTPLVVLGSINLSPESSVVEIDSPDATIYAGYKLLVAPAQFVVELNPFVLRITMDSASIGYSCTGALDYDLQEPTDYNLSGLVDYNAGVLTLDYLIQRALDYRYDHTS